MKSLIALLAFVSVPAFAANTYTCTAVNKADRFQTVTIEIGQSGPLDYLKMSAEEITVSGAPTKFAAANGVITYNLVTTRASYIVNVDANGDVTAWLPANGNFMPCKK